MNRRVLFIVFIMIAMAAPAARAFQPATPDASPEASPIASPVSEVRTAVQASPAASPEASPVAEVTPEGIGNFYNYFSAGTMDDLGYGDVTTPNGQSVVEYFLPLPSGVTPVEDSTVTLVFSHSPLLRADVSTMTVYVNGIPASSVFLDDTNLDRAELEITLPEAARQPGGVLVQVAFSMRLSQEVCEDIDNVGLWATIHAESSYDLRSHAIVGDANLAALQDQFTGFTQPLTIVLPENPTAIERDAAGAIAARVGEWNAQQTGTIEIVTSSDPAASDQGPVIYIGTGERLPTPMNWTGLIWDGTQFNSSNGLVDPDHGVVALLQQPYPALLVSGATDAALVQAVTAITDDRYTAQLSGPYRIVTGEEPVTGIAGSPWSEPTVSFADLGFDQRTIRGEGTSGIDLFFTRPAEWIAGNGGTLDLRVETSAALRTDTSWIGVSINGVPVGTQSIVASESTVTYRFPLTAAGINTIVQDQATNILHLRIELHLEIPRESCQAVDPANAWAALLDDSSIGFPHQPYTGLDLSRLPAPILQMESDASYVIAVPDVNDPADLAAALQTAFAFGLRSGNIDGGKPIIVNAGDVSDEQKQSSSIVAIGNADTNAILAETGISDTVPAIATTSNPDLTTTVAIVESPWAEDRAVMAIVPADGSSSTVSEIMASTVTLSHLTGTSSTVGPDLAVSQTGGAEAPILPPDSTPVVAGEITEVPTEESGIVAEPTAEPDMEADSTEAPDLVAGTNSDADGELEAWQVAGAIILGGIVVGIGAFLWIRLAGRTDIP